jgi:hypothetical protein
MHGGIGYFTEKMFAVQGANCYKIGRIPPIIPILQTGGMNTIPVVEFVHFVCVVVVKTRLIAFFTIGCESSNI